MENNAAINRECWNKRVLIVFVRVDPMFVAGCCCCRVLLSRVLSLCLLCAVCAVLGVCCVFLNAIPSSQDGAATFLPQVRNKVNAHSLITVSLTGEERAVFGVGGERQGRISPPLE